MVLETWMYYLNQGWTCKAFAPKTPIIKETSVNRSLQTLFSIMNFSSLPVSYL